MRSIFSEMRSEYFPSCHTWELDCVCECESVNKGKLGLRNSLGQGRKAALQPGAFHCSCLALKVSQSCSFLREKSRHDHDSRVYKPSHLWIQPACEEGHEQGQGDILLWIPGQISESFSLTSCNGSHQWDQGEVKGEIIGRNDEHHTIRVLADDGCVKMGGLQGREDKESWLLGMKRCYTAWLFYSLISYFYMTAQI